MEDIFRELALSRQENQLLKHTNMELKLANDTLRERGTTFWVSIPKG
ncbi:MAG: hypothetical protein GXX78_03105 [Bacteroidales bacterium]|nr:hypothetical protein [Bacteroidales bacterium]